MKAPAVALVLLLLQTGMDACEVFAASPGETGGIGSGSSIAVIRCERRFVYSKRMARCVRVDSGLIGDKDLYEQGRALALAAHYRNALDALEAIPDPRDAMTLTMIGYAERKLGNFDRSIRAYRDALTIDPKNANAHQYLGVAYFEIGKVELAKLELQALEAICGRTCEQYHDLAQTIAGESDP